MITIFNRKEVLSTFDMKLQADTRCVLAQNNIDYTVWARSPHSASLGRTGRAYVGTLGMDMNHYYEYKIYVHKKDYDRAIGLIGCR